MALYELKTTVEYADMLCSHTRMVDFREKSKNIKVGDIIRYVPMYDARPVKGHPITKKRFGVIAVDGSDPRIHKNFDLLCLVEIEPEFE